MLCYRTWQSEVKRAFLDKLHPELNAEEVGVTVKAQVAVLVMGAAGAQPDPAFRVVHGNAARQGKDLVRVYLYAVFPAVGVGDNFTPVTFSRKYFRVTLSQNEHNKC